MKKITNKEIKIIQQDTGAVIFDKKNGVYFQVNESGQFLLEELNKVDSEKDLIEKLEKKFSLGHVEATNDVRSFLKKLEEMRIL